MPARSYVELPPGWRRVAADGPGPFVTWERLQGPDGRVVHWHSRRHRKARAPGGRAGVWWRPDRTGWWMGVLFAIGSTCFAVAAIASQWASVTRPGIGVTYFVGSLFFTTAAALQFHEAVDVERRPEHAARTGRRWWSWEPARIDWLASGIQLVGTLFFNVSTFLALQRGLDARQTNLRVWAPDVFGSVCFLVASELAYAEVCHRWVCLQRRSLPWWIVALNLVGSIAFGVSAAAALVEPSTNEPVSAAIANAGTAIGAVCFLAGAVLLLPEAARTTPSAAVPPAAVRPQPAPAA
jgi:hypothetical protein